LKRPKPLAGRALDACLSDIAKIGLWTRFADVQMTKTHEKSLRLWKNACISTATNVQKPRFFLVSSFCPRTVQLRYNVFPARSAARKPLTL
jgi:hypothetical protein